MIYQKAKCGNGWLYIEDQPGFVSGLWLTCSVNYTGNALYDELPRPFKTPAACKGYATRLVGEKLDWQVVEPVSEE